MSPAYVPPVRRNKEIIILLGLLAGMMVFVLWYVIDRRAKNRANATPAAVQPITPARP